MKSGNVINGKMASTQVQQRETKPAMLCRRPPRRLSAVAFCNMEYLFDGILLKDVLTIAVLPL